MEFDVADPKETIGREQIRGNSEFMSPLITVSWFPAQKDMTSRLSLLWRVSQLASLQTIWRSSSLTITGFETQKEGREEHRIDNASDE